MILSKKIIKELQDNKFEAYYYKDTARDFYLKKENERSFIYITTSAPLSKIREVCKKLNLFCKIQHKINNMTLELIAEDKYIIAPFIKTKVKNSYAVRNYSDKAYDMISSQDFTANSFLYDPITKKFKFYTGANEDVKSKLIRTIGDSHKKITENRMHMLEAGKLLSELGTGWQVEYETFEAITQRSLEIAIVSHEAIRDFFTELMTFSEKPSLAFRFFKNTSIISEVLPPLSKSYGLAQSNKSNNLDLFNHIMYCLDSVGKDKKNYIALRWACIFHDIAKPYTKSYDDKGNIHFYGHDKIGAVFATRWLDAHKFNKKLIQKVSVICRYHLFDASLKLDEKAVKRLISRVGEDNIYDLINMREADRYGTGRDDISMKKVEVLKGKVKNILN